MASLVEHCIVAVENRRTKTKNTLDVLGRLMAELDKMALEHVKRSQADYLQYGIAAADGTVTRSIANEREIVTAS
jgi:hypothetical protein